MKLYGMTGKCGDELSLSLCVAALYVVAAAIPFAANADITTNYWQGADGAAWGTPGNWSQNHVPTIDEYVIFPDKGPSYSINVDGDYGVGCFYVDYRNEGASDVATLTLTGCGTITGGNIGNTHFVRTNRKLVLESGVTLDLQKDGATLRVYNGFVIKAGATNIVKSLIMHWSGSYVALEGGYLKVNETTAYRNSNSIRLEEGSVYYSGVITKSSDASSSAALNFELNGGLASIRNLTLSKDSTLTMNGGTFEFRGLPTIAAETTINFNGGTNEFAVAVTDGAIARRFICGNEKTAIHVTATSSSSLLIDESCTITAPLEVDGGIYFTNKVTVVSPNPILTKTFYNGAAEGGNPATIRAPAIVMKTGAPFTTASKTRQFYIDGPTTFRSIGNITGRAGTTPYPYLTGDVTIDTRDWYDESVTHTLTMELASYEDASLTIKGGGSLTMAQQYSGSTHIPYNSVVVEEGTTLSLRVGGSTDGKFHTERFVLGPNTTLNLDLTKGGTAAYYNAVIAGKWEIDPTARIIVNIPDDFTSGAIPVFIDKGSDSIADYTSQITLTGATEGCTLVRSGGSIVAVKKTVTEASGSYPFEWTGGGETDQWDDPANWYCGVGVPATTTNCVFGACDAKTTSRYFAGGYTVNSITFLDTAVSSFRITTGGNNTFVTFNNKVLQSSSMLPQFFDIRVRSVNDLAIYANAEGPIVLAGFVAKTEDRTLTLKGDIRCNNGTVSTTYRKWPKLAFAKENGRNWSRFSVMGSSMSITNQTDALNVAKASLRVEEGATLVFNNGTSSSKYQWTAEPHRIMVYGTLRIESPFVGGANQMYGGDGALEIKSSIQPSTAATRIGLTDKLLVKLSAPWKTVASTGADTPLTIAAYSGRPVLHTARSWTYGPEAGTVTATTPADRAVFIRPEATLAVEPGGGTATFVDPVAGSGTLEITNGTLVAQGGISAETHVAVAADAAFDLGASDASLAGIDVADGGTLIFSGGVFTVSGDVSMSGANLQVSDGVMGSGPGWKRLLVAKSISGAPLLPGPNWESRTLALENGSVAFEVRIVHGACLIMR